VSPVIFADRASIIATTSSIDGCADHVGWAPLSARAFRHRLSLAFEQLVDFVPLASEFVNDRLMRTANGATAIEDVNLPLQRISALEQLLFVLGFHSCHPLLSAKHMGSGGQAR